MITTHPDGIIVNSYSESYRFPESLCCTLLCMKSLGFNWKTKITINSQILSNVSTSVAWITKWVSNINNSWNLRWRYGSDIKGYIYNPSKLPKITEAPELHTPWILSLSNLTLPFRTLLLVCTKHTLIRAPLSLQYLLHIFYLFSRYTCFLQ